MDTSNPQSFVGLKYKWLNDPNIRIITKYEFPNLYVSMTCSYDYNFRFLFEHFIEWVKTGDAVLINDINNIDEEML